jgi:hypothetical protein
MLLLVRQRWAIESQWHWPRDTQLGEDAHRYTQLNGVQVVGAADLGPQLVALQRFPIDLRWFDGRGA